MSRARATALALVNWKGVFYERYLLDRHVTALEGANGAGKTTVMIAAYVVLLPDLARLRFTNLGESGATGGDKGIWGRLGERGRPSYAAMEIELPGGERVIAGIHLERKAEPSLELTPFLVSGVDLRGSLRDVLLVTEGEHESVPVLADVRAAVARLGGRLDVFASAKDYFAALFERGVTPLRMATEEDKNKLNEMLRTSMTGGISRALTSELRAFLLKEETGLGDALSRIRANLDACRRSRIEVGEARRLEHEIAGVYDAGQEMFAVAMLAARAHAEERARRAVEARAVRDDAARAARDLDQAIAEGTARHAAQRALLDEARRAHEDAVLRREKVGRARALVCRLEALAPGIARAERAATEAGAAQAAAAAEREVRRQERDHAREVYDRAARGLADLQGGLEELHRNAHAYRRLVRQLAAAREALGDPALDEERAPAALEGVRARLSEIDVARARASAEDEVAAVRRDEHARAAAALAQIEGKVDPTRAHHDARRALARLAELEGLAARHAELGEELERGRQLAERQAAVSARASALGIAGGTGPVSLTIAKHLAEAEEELRAAEEASRVAQARPEDARRARDEARRRAAEHEARAARWSEAVAIAARLEASLGGAVRTREALAAARARLADDRDAARARLAEAKGRRERLLEEAVALETSASAAHPDLLRLRDELDAELLASRFEDLDVAEAARMEAELGPLADALVVDDPVAVAERLAGRPRDLATVWLVRADTVVGGAEAGAAGDDRVVIEPYGARITRIPGRPSLGRRARERTVIALRAEAEGMGAEIERALESLRGVEALARDADRLLAEAALLELTDPAEAAIRALQEAAAAEAAERASLEIAAAERQRALAARPRVDALRALVADAFLLDPPDHAARVRDLEGALVRATEARDELRRTEAARAVLADLVHALRAPPPAAEDPDQRDALERDRARLFRAREALEDVVRDPHALRFADVERALAEQSAVAPALETQLARARDGVNAAEEALRAAEAAWEAATSSWQKAESQRDASSAHAARLREELAAEGLGEPPEGAVEAALDAASARAAERATLERDERAQETAVALLRERLAQAHRALTVAQDRVLAEEQGAAPAAEAWAHARRAAEKAGVLGGALASRFADARSERPSMALWADVSSRAEVLLDRLAAARGGAECAAAIRAPLDARRASTDEWLAAWIAVREWVKRRLPAPIAELADPLEGLERLRDDLRRVEERLTGQESDLRGASEDVARGIDVHLRRASHQVRRLNQNLEGVQFGSITGIRVQMRRIERMDQVLRALREGAAQELLFQSMLPIEEALDEIFRRYGGGRAGGQRILDYREYTELGVEIRRQAEGDWEVASPTRLSTGEAIGVGAALMMVILTEWERDANLLRPKRATGSLRFLFLDEANRLSQDNLGVLFDLCRSLDLQLLIAAPEVARAEGNTTYRLVRRLSSDGREEVLVSGRRTEGSTLPGVC